MSIEIDHAADEYTRHLFDVLNGVHNEYWKSRMRFA
jgi:hypothetical protein